jgi:hypothetical protein
MAMECGPKFLSESASGRPFILFAPRVIFIKTIRNFFRDRRILRFRDRRAILLLDSLPSDFTGKSSGSRPFPSPGTQVAFFKAA